MYVWKHGLVGAEDVEQAGEEGGHRLEHIPGPARRRGLMLGAVDRKDIR